MEKKTPPPYWKVKASPIVREYFESQKKKWHGHDYEMYGIVDEYGPDGWSDIYPPEYDDLPTLTQAQFKKHFYDPWKAGQAFDNMMGNAIEKLNELLPTTAANVHERIKPNSLEALKAIQGIDKQHPKRITLAKHNRITAEMQRQREQLQGELAKKQAESDNYRKAYVDESMKVIKVQGKIEELEQRKKDWEHVLNARIAQLEDERGQQHQQILNLTDQKSALVQQVNKKDSLLNEKQKYIHAAEQKFINCANDLENKSAMLKEAEDHISKLHVTHLREINELSKQRDAMAAVVIVVGLIALGLAVAVLNGIS